MQVEEMPEKKVEELSEKVYETKVKNEVEDDQEDIGAYYLYVVCANDTYENIAKAYNMDEKVIRDYNNNLSLDVGQILIIPYDSKTDTNKVCLEVIGLIQLSPKVYKVKTKQGFYCVKLYKIKNLKMPINIFKHYICIILFQSLKIKRIIILPLIMTSSFI